MSSGPARHTGGCLCGAVRYELAGTLVDAGYCHCRQCQRASGAPVVAWCPYPIAAFRYTSGVPAAHRSSARYQREFCGSCGTALVFRRQLDAELIDVTLASLDTPDAIAPQYHIWRMSRIAWFETSDALPRHEDAGPDQA